MQISSRAVAKIHELLASEREYIESNDLVPIISWIFNREGEEDNPGPVLGLIERSRVAGHETEGYSDSGLVVYNGLPDDLRMRFRHHVLDCDERAFEFIAPSVSA